MSLVMSMIHDWKGKLLAGADIRDSKPVDNQTESPYDSNYRETEKQPDNSKLERKHNV